MTFKLPDHILKTVTSIESDSNAILLLRHAERGYIAPGDDGVETDLTPFGYEQSFAFGEQLGKRLKWAHYSPLLRARRTAELFMKGAKATEPLLSANNLLGDPGPFVFDCKLAGQLFASLGTECLVKKHAKGESLEGIRSAKEGAKLFSEHIKELLETQKGLGIMVSHDAIIIPLIAAWTGESFENRWLNPLDGALFVADKDNVLIYRNDKVTKI